MARISFIKFSGMNLYLKIILLNKKKICAFLNLHSRKFSTKLERRNSTNSLINQLNPSIKISDELRFDGKVVVITGAGAGLGRSYAFLFGSRGAKVVVNDLGGTRHGDGSSSSAADAVVNEITRNGGQAVANYDNVLDGEKIIQTAIESFGRIDVLVNNAGILRDKSFTRMSENDWDIIQNVHVKGAMKTSQAAWLYFKEQKYGRLIFTASNSGLYGNFGQANYSAAKMALVGLAKTLAIEGQKNGINSNVIVPTAASRFTEDILPPDFFQQLKPELIAPVVVWLCHENCAENGSIIESALGWAGKCHLIRSNGCVLRKTVNELVVPEVVRDNWSKVTDMSNAKHCQTIAETTGELINVVEVLSSPVDSSSSKYTSTVTYNVRDVILYALGVGATVADAYDRTFIYENTENFAVLPTYYTIFAQMSSDILAKTLPNEEINLGGIVHGEQYMKVLKKIPTEATVETRLSVQAALDKEKHAILLIKHETFNVENREKISEGQMVSVILGAGGFGGPKNSEHEIPTVAMPNRKPDASCTQKTTCDQAALYRLSGDMNSFHINENLSILGEFEKPNLHGLCSLGFATRHVLKMFASGDSELFDAMKVRFEKPVIPGQTLRSDMWRVDKRIHFQVVVVETGDVVISDAYIDLKAVRPLTPSSEL